MATLGDDEVGVLLRGLDELVVSRSNDLQILGDNRVHRAAPFVYIPSKSTDESNIVRGFHKKLQIDKVSYPFLEVDHYSLDDNQLFRLNRNRLLQTPMMDKVIPGQLDGFEMLQAEKLFMEEIAVEGFGMIEVVSRYVLVADELCRFVVAVLGNEDKIRDDFGDLPDDRCFPRTRPAADSDQSCFV